LFSFLTNFLESIFMTIEMKELMQAPKFEGYGTFVMCRPGSGDWPPNYLFEFFGGQVSLEVEESETLDPPAVGSSFFLSGKVRYNPRNGTVSLLADEKKFIAAISAEQYVSGLRIKGVGIVEQKISTTMNRQTFLKATLKWHGAVHEFRKLSPELFQRLPNRGGAVRFELGLLVQTERNLTGQSVQLQVPSLVSVQLDNLSGSVPAASSSSTVPTPTPSPSAPSPAKSSPTRA
jgi:hypothetical protein